MVTADARLLVGRVGGSALTWIDSKGATVTGNYNIVYAYNAGAPGDLSGWSQLYPIAHAPYDSRLAAYGFADRPFRDPENVTIPEDTDLPANYPWIDRQGRNLFFTTMNATNYFWDNFAKQVRARYQLDGVTPSWTDPSTEAAIANYDEPSNTRGQAVMGLWTNGKMVVLDELLNNTDYGTLVADSVQRNVILYGQGVSVRVGARGATTSPRRTLRACRLSPSRTRRSSTRRRTRSASSRRCSRARPATWSGSSTTGRPAPRSRSTTSWTGTSSSSRP